MPVGSLPYKLVSYLSITLALNYCVMSQPQNNHHGHHYHGQQPHYGDYYDEVQTDTFKFEDVQKGPISNGTLEIPVDFAEDINGYSVNDLLLNYVDYGDGDSKKPHLEDRFGGERNAGIVPKMAGCMPEMRTIQLAQSDDPSILYIPECTRVERCAGCCVHKLLSCQPTEIETISYQVTKTQYTWNRKLKFIEKEIVPVERHLKCKCNCRIKPEDCNSFQEYKKSECRCACKNIDEQKKCEKNSDKKLWNPDLCACVCRNASQCSTGYRFDQNDCRCRPSLQKRRLTYLNYYP